ncbi:MAG: STAS domain-containing protein [Deltaproteobacteria bacterium]|nr:STAS domain-containing protein [Deltaproteobacteria bacterium]
MGKNRNYREAGDSVILYPENYINDIEGEKLEDMCDIFLARGFKKIIIDFSETDLINSIGVSIMIGIIEKIKDKKGLILFSGLKKVNHDIFSIVGLTKHIPVFSTEKEALDVVSCEDRLPM